MFKYCEDKKFARRSNKSDKYPCYRTVIAHALFKYYKYSQSDETVKEEFNKLITDYQSDNLYKNKEFLDLYPVAMENKHIGYLLVDQTNGCFPLVIYPFSKTSTSGELSASRKSGLDNVVKDLTENIDNIIAEFDDHENWDEKLQNILQKKYFHYSDEEEQPKL